MTCGELRLEAQGLVWTFSAADAAASKALYSPRFIDASAGRASNCRFVFLPLQTSQCGSAAPGRIKMLGAATPVRICIQGEPLPVVHPQKPQAAQALPIVCALASSDNPTGLQPVRRCRLQLAFTVVAGEILLSTEESATSSDDSPDHANEDSENRAAAATSDQKRGCRGGRGRRGGTRRKVEMPSCSYLAGATDDVRPPPPGLDAPPGLAPPPAQAASQPSLTAGEMLAPFCFYAQRACARYVLQAWQSHLACTEAAPQDACALWTYNACEAHGARCEVRWEPL